MLPKLIKHYKENATMIKFWNIDAWHDFTDARTLSKTYVKLL